MHPSIPRLVRIIPRASLLSKITPGSTSKIDIISPPVPQPKEKKVTLIEALLRQKEFLGPEWPINLRIEPVVTKDSLARVHGDHRTQLKGLLKER